MRSYEFMIRALRAFAPVAVAAAGLLASAAPAEAGYIVLNNDEWTFSGSGYANAPTADVFINNITNLFTGDQPGDFLAYSTNFGLTGTQLRTSVESAGHTWTVSTAVPFTAASLAAYDAVFFAGPVGSGYPDQSVIEAYLLGGGNVYIGAGTGSLGPAAEAAGWNDVLALTGLRFRSYYNGIGGTIPPVGPHPLLAGVSSLYFSNGNTIDDLDLGDDTGEILFSLGGQGMLALGRFGQLPPPSQYQPPSAVPEPSSAALFIGGIGLVALRRRRRRAAP